jgi:hypothetical protein
MARHTRPKIDDELIDTLLEGREPSAAAREMSVTGQALASEKPSGRSPESRPTGRFPAATPRLVRRAGAPGARPQVSFWPAGPYGWQ